MTTGDADVVLAPDAPPTLVRPVGSARPVRRRAGAGALADLRAARDRAQAVLTVPTVGVSRRWIRSVAARPSVDLTDWAHHVAYAERRDPRALEHLFAHYGDYASRAARRRYRHREPVDDLVQVSHEALMLALRRFDPKRRIPFLAFAGPTIDGCLSRHFRDAGWALRVPRAVHDLSRPQRDAFDLLAQDLGRAPTLTEVADVMGVPLDQLEAVERARLARAASSIEAPARDGEVTVELGAADPVLVSADDRVALRRGLAQLDDDDVRLLTWYFFDEESQTRIAERLGVSQMQVSRLLARAVQRLRPFLSPNL